MTPALSHNQQKSLWIALSVLLALLAAELIAILFLNDGHLVFTLDDPYIHLALAENLLQGHYGLNMGEFSSPSSSLLWPFVIAPFSRTPFSAYGILLLNTLFAAGTVAIFWKALRPSPAPEAARNSRTETFFTCLLIALTFATNLVGLVYLGMEHAFQVFLSVAIVFGLIQNTEQGPDQKTAPGWLFAAIVLAPWVRFECLALSLPALALLYSRGYRAKSILAAGILLAAIAAFGMFLMHLGLGPIPLSISSKSPFLYSGRGIKVLYDVLRTNLASSRGVLLALGALFLLFTALAKNQPKRKRGLAAALAIATGLHVCLGQIGGYNRYEIYVTATTLLGVLYLSKETLYTLPQRSGLCPSLIALFLGVAVLFFPYVEADRILPVASNNIYQQQYQMGRFAEQYYRKPIAVNDVGLTSYRNENYVLDLCGLASKEAFDYQKSGVPPVEWIPELAQKHNVEFAMIYDAWWFSQDSWGNYRIPKGWDKLGELKLGRTQITPAENSVSFYALTPAAAAEARSLLQEFRKTLPKGVVFDLN